VSSIGVTVELPREEETELATCVMSSCEVRAPDENSLLPATEQLELIDEGETAGAESCPRGAAAAWGADGGEPPTGDEPELSPPAAEELRVDCAVAGAAAESGGSSGLAMLWLVRKSMRGEEQIAA
jgi:hypothetical protein